MVQETATAAARAHSNIALIKYWGKRDESLILPINSSLSVTLDQFYTTTTVKFCSDLHADIFILNNAIAGEAETRKVSQFLNRMREISGKDLQAIVQSENHVPTASGFASSASGFAALAAASAKALDLNLSNTELSRLARQGSGSACRSVFGGFVEWRKGEHEDGSDSYGIQLEENWDFSVLTVLVTSEYKKISSREGMKRTVETSPFYASWVEEAEKDLLLAKAAIKEQNFTKLGQVSEANALKMHATTFGANPPFFYWNSATLEIMNMVQSLRMEGMEAYFTMDAGPNVVVLCQSENEQAVYEKLLSISSVNEVNICHPGPGVTY